MGDLFQFLYITHHSQNLFCFEMPQSLFFVFSLYLCLVLPLLRFFQSQFRPLLRFHLSPAIRSRWFDNRLFHWGSARRLADSPTTRTHLFCRPVVRRCLPPHSHSRWPASSQIWRLFTQLHYYYCWGHRPPTDDHRGRLSGLLFDKSIEWLLTGMAAGRAQWRCRMKTDVLHWQQKRNCGRRRFKVEKRHNKLKSFANGNLYLRPVSISADRLVDLS